MSQVEVLLEKIDDKIEILVEGFQFLNDKIDRVNSELQDRIAGTEMRLGQRIDQLEERVNVVEVSLGSRIDETNIRLSQIDRRLERLETPRTHIRRAT